MSANNYNVPIIQILRNQLIAFTILEDLIWQIYGHLSRCSTARGSSSGFSLVGPTKVKARKSFLFTEGFPEVENKEHLFDFVVSLFDGGMKRRKKASSKNFFDRKCNLHLF